MTTVSIHIVPQWTFEIAALCASLAESIASKHSVQAHLPPLAGLNMAHNSIVQSFELLDFYYQKWSEIENNESFRTNNQNLLKENEQRISLIQKSTFIFSMSAFEAAAKSALNLPGCPINITGNRIYISGIMKDSHKAGMIDDRDAEIWSFAVELRNCMVHSNAIAEKTIKLDLDQGLSLEMTAGKMTQSSARKSILFHREILASYARWCDAFLSRRQI